MLYKGCRYASDYFLITYPFMSVVLHLVGVGIVRGLLGST